MKPPCLKNSKCKKLQLRELNYSSKEVVYWKINDKESLKIPINTFRYEVDSKHVMYRSLINNFKIVSPLQV